uniref:Uncharacterized protein n=1 Tax=Hyaloperonospora arabidopsidis (strain Emoy2) TaxID=559515 RepID=M4BGB2_HYAAE
MDDDRPRSANTGRIVDSRFARGPILESSKQLKEEKGGVESSHPQSTRASNSNQVHPQREVIPSRHVREVRSHSREPEKPRRQQKDSPLGPLVASAIPTVQTNLPQRTSKRHRLAQDHCRNQPDHDKGVKPDRHPGPCSDLATSTDVLIDTMLSSLL